MLDNYVLFGATSKGDVTEDTKPVAKSSVVGDGAGNIPLNFENIGAGKSKLVAGAQIRYKLYGKEKSTDGSWGAPIVNTLDASALKIPANTPYRVFKVDVTVEYGN